MSPSRTVPASAELIRFVRDTLGCGCPDDVVASTVVERSAAGEPGLDVGGRLLVRVLPTRDLSELMAGFEQTVARLRAERDRRGFRRLRLVVAHHDPDAVSEVLQSMLATSAAADAAVFVHVVPTAALPSALIVAD